MAEGGISVDHSTVDRWAIRLLSVQVILLSGIELMDKIKKGQMKDSDKGYTPEEQFYSLAAKPPRLGNRPTIVPASLSRQNQNFHCTCEFNALI